MESPTRTTDGLHSLDAGGTPRLTAELIAWLDSRPDATDRGDATYTGAPDDVIVGFYRWPNRAALWLMVESRNPKLARLGRIVARIAAGDGPTDAALLEGAHPDDAEHTALRALRTFLTRRAAIRLRLDRRGAED